MQRQKKKKSQLYLTNDCTEKGLKSLTNFLQSDKKKAKYKQFKGCISVRTKQKSQRKFIKTKLLVFVKPTLFASLPDIVVTSTVIDTIPRITPDIAASATSTK